MGNDMQGSWEALPDDVAEWMGMPDVAPIVPAPRQSWLSKLRRNRAQGGLTEAV